jgi:hypothetical protein
MNTVRHKNYKFTGDELNLRSMHYAKLLSLFAFNLILLFVREYLKNE